MVNKWGVRVLSVTNALGWVRHAHAGDVFRLLGLKAGGHLPADGMAERLIDGVRVYVSPIVASVCTCSGRQSWARHSRACRMRRGSRPHRVYAICACGRHVPVGRLHQHKCSGWVVDGSRCQSCGATERDGCYCGVRPSSVEGVK